MRHPSDSKVMILVLLIRCAAAAAARVLTSWFDRFDS